MLNYDWSTLLTLSGLGTLLGLIALDLLLSGDNALVIALVAQGLPRTQQRTAMIAGTGVAIVLRVLMAFVAGYLLSIPGFALVGGLYLLWVAISMTRQEEAPATATAVQAALLVAIFKIGMADAMMSLDNVAAIAALTGGDIVLMAVGVLISIPFVIVGAVAIKWLLDRAPWLVWVGAVLLGAVAGKVIAEDAWLRGLAAGNVPHQEMREALMLIGAAFVSAVAWMLHMFRSPTADPYEDWNGF